MTWDRDMEAAADHARRNGAEPWRVNHMPERRDIWHDGATAAELDAMDFPPIKWIVPGIIAEGCTLLAGKPKLGKSWLVLDAALAVASGARRSGRGASRATSSISRSKTTGVVCNPACGGCGRPEPPCRSGSG